MHTNVLNRDALRIRPAFAGGLRGAATQPVVRVAMPLVTALDAELVQAYRDAIYVVHAAPPFQLRVGHASPELEGFFVQTRTRCCAFLTACNPRGEPLSEEENSRHQASLGQQLKQRGLAYLGGAGRDPAGRWAGEPSFVVPGLPLEAAKKLGRQFAQNAIVWCGPDTVPRLELLR